MLLATTRIKISSTVSLWKKPTVSGISLAKGTNWHVVQDIIMSILSVRSRIKVLPTRFHIGVPCKMVDLLLLESKHSCNINMCFSTMLCCKQFQNNKFLMFKFS